MRDNPDMLLWRSHGMQTIKLLARFSTDLAKTFQPKGGSVCALFFKKRRFRASAQQGRFPTWSDCLKRKGGKQS